MERDTHCSHLSLFPSYLGTPPIPGKLRNPHTFLSLLTDGVYDTCSADSPCWTQPPCHRELYLEECLCNTHILLHHVGCRLGILPPASYTTEHHTWGRRQGAVWSGDYYGMDEPMPQFIKEASWWKNSVGYCRCHCSLPPSLVGLHICKQGDAVLLAHSLQDGNLSEVKKPVLKMRICNFL